MAYKTCGVCKLKKKLHFFEPTGKGKYIHGIVREHTKKRQDVCTTCKVDSPEDSTLRKLQLSLSRQAGLRKTKTDVELDKTRTTIYLMDYLGSSWRSISLTDAQSLISEQLVVIYNPYILVCIKPTKHMKMEHIYREVITRNKTENRGVSLC